MAPPFVLDYVVLHEICHIRYMNHSKDYWAMVEGYMPDYRGAKEWLKKNACKLGF
jgi:predicted metal-dependent hydrolase